MKFAPKIHTVSECIETKSDFIVRLIGPPGTARSAERIAPGKRVAVSGGIAREVSPR